MQLNNKPMSKLLKNNRKNTTPQWQLDKMKTIISDRWEEVWQSVNYRSKQEQS